MRPSKFTEDQMRQALRRVSAGTPAAQVCREIGITQTTFYRWRKKYQGTANGHAQGAQELRVENQRLKEIVAELLLDKRAGTG